MNAAELRPATRHDLGIVVDWVTDAQICRLWSGGREPFPIDRERFVSVIAPAGAVQLVLESDDRIVGFARYQLLGDVRAHLSRLLVDPDERGQGFGTLLVAELLEWAREDGAQSATLWVSPDNTAALSAYRTAGFTPATPPPNHRLQASNHLFMSKVLPQE